jgi:hypothetical protein
LCDVSSREAFLFQFSEAFAQISLFSEASSFVAYDGHNSRHVSLWPKEERHGKGN